MVVMGTMAAVGAISSVMGSRSAAKKAKKLGRLNASYIRKETAENIRRMRGQQESTRSTTRAMMGASGVSGQSETNALYLEAMAAEQGRELDWAFKAGESRARIARAGGNAEASNLRTQGVTNAFTGMTQMAGAFGI